MLPIITFCLLVAGAGSTAYLARDIRLRRRVNARLGYGANITEPIIADDLRMTPRLFARRHYVLPWLGAVLVALALRWIVGLPFAFAGALGLVAGLLLQQFDALLLVRAADRIENQLADAIDMLVSSLKAGSAVESALENAVNEGRQPLRGELDDVLARIRLGAEPRQAIDQLATRIPLETFQLFSLALAVHWDVGGSLTQTLATVGRTIRNRIEISRRLSALTTQSRASIVAILLTTYFIAGLMWRNNPDRMVAFLATTFGQWSVAGAIVLQGVGIVWIAALSRPRF